MNTTSSTSAPNLALSEFIAGAGSIHAWSLLAWDDVMTRYRRTMLGPFWLTLSHAATIGALGLSFSIILRQPIGDYFVYLAAGITVWAFISSSLVEAPSIFLRSANILNTFDLPASIHLFRAVLSQFIVFAHHIVLYVLALIFIKNVASVNTLLAIPGLLVLAAAALGWTTTLAFGGARFRDVGPAITSVISILFLLTPIFWERTHMAQAQWFVLINPLYHLIEIVRAPLLGRPPELLSWLYSIAFASVNCAIGIATFAYKRRTLNYWL